MFNGMSSTKIQQHSFREYHRVLKHVQFRQTSLELLNPGNQH